MWDFRGDSECGTNLGASLLASFCVSDPISAQLWFAGRSLVGREDDATGYGEQIWDFSNHSAIVTNIPTYVSCVDGVV